MGKITYRDGVAIGELGFYVPSLVVAIFLVIRHGYSRNSGWIFLVIFALVRIIGAGFQLAEINNTTSTSLYTGSLIMQNIGLSPLELATLGLLNRVLTNISRNYKVLVKPSYLRLIQVMVVVGLILAIVGAVDTSNDLATTGQWHPQKLSKVGTALFVAAYAIIALTIVSTLFLVSYAAADEKRILVVLILTMPFLAVRVIYSAISNFSTLASFNVLNGNVTIMMVMELIMELICVILYEIVGLMVQKEVKVSAPLGDATMYHQASSTSHASHNSKPSASSSTKVLRALGKYTIIGRLVTKVHQSRKS